MLRSTQTYHVPDVNFDDHCPEKTKCISVYLPTLAVGGPKEEVACIDEVDIVEETVTANDRPAQPNHKNVHCGLSLRIPGSEYHSDKNQQPIDVVLTEEVWNIEGSPYEAPELYIREKTAPVPFRNIDRAFRRHASVASSLVEIAVYRGKIQQRTFEFCVKMAPGHVASSIIFAYSSWWFRGIMAGCLPRRSEARPFLIIRDVSKSTMLDFYRLS